jgi:hypothetical protein
MTEPNGLFYATALLLCDIEFLKEHSSDVEAEDLPEGPVRNLIRYALFHYREHGMVLTPEALQAYLVGLDDEETEEELTETLTYCRDLGQQIEALPIIRTRAGEWLKQRFVGRAIDEAARALDHKDTELAVEALRRAERGGDEPRQELHLDTALGPVLVTGVTSDYIPTGIDALDAVLDGGLRPAEFGIWLASTGVGKSMLGPIATASAFLHNKKVLYYTTELTAAQILSRIAGAIFKTPIKKLSDTPDLYVRALAQIREMACLDQADILIREGLGTLGMLKADLDQLARNGWVPDLLMLDSADDMPAGEKHDKEYQIHSSNYRALRNHFAQTRRLAVWTTCQTNRDGVDKGKIRLSYIGESYDKAKKAHLIVGIAQTEQEKQAPFAPHLRLVVLKDSLHGATGNSWGFNAMFGRGDMGWPELEPDTEGL